MGKGLREVIQAQKGHFNIHYSPNVPTTYDLAGIGARSPFFSNKKDVKIRYKVKVSRH